MRKKTTQNPREHQPINWLSVCVWSATQESGEKTRKILTSRWLGIRVRETLDEMRDHDRDNDGDGAKAPTFRVLLSRSATRLSRLRRTSLSWSGAAEVCICVLAAPMFL